MGVEMVVILGKGFMVPCHIFRRDMDDDELEMITNSDMVGYNLFFQDNYGQKDWQCVFICKDDDSDQINYIMDRKIGGTPLSLLRHGIYG